MGELGAEPCPHPLLLKGGQQAQRPGPRGDDAHSARPARRQQVRALIGTGVALASPSAGPQPGLPGVCIPGRGPSPPACPVSPGPEMTQTPWSLGPGLGWRSSHQGPCLGAGSWVEPTHIPQLSPWGFTQAGLRPGEQSGHRGSPPSRGLQSLWHMDRGRGHRVGSRPSDVRHRGLEFVCVPPFLSVQAVTHPGPQPPGL